MRMEERWTRKTVAHAEEVVTMMLCENPELDEGVSWGKVTIDDGALGSGIGDFQKCGETFSCSMTV